MWTVVLSELDLRFCVHKSLIATCTQLRRIVDVLGALSTTRILRNRRRYNNYYYRQHVKYSVPSQNLAKKNVVGTCNFWLKKANVYLSRSYAITFVLAMPSKLYILSMKCDRKRQKKYVKPAWVGAELSNKLGLGQQNECSA